MSTTITPSELDALVTIKDFVRYAVSRFNQSGLFYGHGTTTALDEAVYLVLQSLELPPELPEPYFDSRLLPSERAHLATLIERRCRDQVPVAYLTRRAWFAGLEFYVDERVLIPRSPIAELVEEQFQPWIDPGRVDRLLDLCTGSACIAIACAYAFPEATVDAADISEEALEVARINVDRHHLADRVRPVASDLFSGLADQRYDLIVSNPPYVGAEEMASLPAEYRHEPELALAAGAEGLDLVVRMLHEAPRHLEPEGILVVEVGNTQAALEARFPQVPFTWLDFEFGGHGIFVLSRQQLVDFRPVFAEAL